MPFIGSHRALPQGAPCSGPRSGTGGGLVVHPQLDRVRTLPVIKADHQLHGAPARPEAKPLLATGWSTAWVASCCRLPGGWPGGAGGASVPAVVLPERPSGRRGAV